MAFTYLLPITNIEPGISVRVQLASSTGASLAFADGSSAKLATSLGGSAYYLYSTYWPSGSDLPFNVYISNHSTASVLGSTAFNSYDVQGVTTGAGGIETVITIEDSGAIPIQGVEVWITTDALGLNVVAGTAVTNTFGIVTFYLDAGTYYIWKLKPEYSFTNPATIVVS